MQDIGVPQGSVLGPLLFLIFINDLPLSVNNLKSILFADDTTLYYSHNNINTLRNVLNTDLMHVKNWLHANQLTLNADKTYFIIFSLKKIPRDLRILIGSNVIKQESSGKFLGVVLDERLTFNNHVALTTKKVSKLIGMFHRLKHFFPSHILKQLYFSLIQPYLSYCITAWGKASRQTLNPLIVLQKRAVRIITESEYLAHTSPLFKSLAVLKLDDIHHHAVLVHMHKTLIMDKYPSLRREINLSQPHHNYFTRHVDFILPFVRIDKYRQSLLYQGLLKWNALPTQLKNMQNILPFKKMGKKLLLQEY